MIFTKYFSVFKINLQDSLHYRFNIFFKSVGVLAYLFVFIFLWRAIYAANPLEGFSLAQLLWYFALAQSIRFASGKPVKEISDLIQSGDITLFLNKPVNFLWYNFSLSLGKSCFAFVLSVVVGSVLIGSYFGLPTVQLVHAPFIILVILLAVLLNYLVSFSIALIAFWVEDARPFSWIYDKLILVVGGLLFPLELLPPFFRSIAEYLPTAYYLYFPAKLFVLFSWDFFQTVIVVQLLFIVAFLIIASVLFHIGTKRLSINGG